MSLSYYLARNDKSVAIFELVNQVEALTTELAASQKECERLRKDAERWAYWKPRLIAADFEWGQFKEPVLVFSLNCKISADIDKSTDEATAAIAAQQPTEPK